jgi:hypothetical protein
MRSSQSVLCQAFGRDRFGLPAAPCLKEESRGESNWENRVAWSQARPFSDE